MKQKNIYEEGKGHIKLRKKEKETKKNETK